MNIRRVGIIANMGKQNAVKESVKLGAWLLERGISVVYEEELAPKVAGLESATSERMGDMVDMIVAFGGDGTLLKTARAVQGHDVPIMGVNLGSFGFMTVVNLHEIYDAMELALKGDCRTSKRMMLDASVNGGHLSALNDVVINRGNLSRMVNLETFVDEKYLTTFKADGLIISTPTGSTAYSLSAGGPIVFPEMDAVIITPICPHTLSNRPIVIPPESAIKIVLYTREEGATVTADGQDSILMKSGDTVTIVKAEHGVRLFDSSERDYMEVLRGKLGWGGLP